MTDPFGQKRIKCHSFEVKKPTASADISVLTSSTGARCLPKETSRHQAELSTVFLSLDTAVACLKATGVNTARIYGLFSYFY